jgi:hypothetical protein
VYALGTCCWPVMTQPVRCRVASEAECEPYGRVYRRHRNRRTQGKQRMKSKESVRARLGLRAVLCPSRLGSRRLSRKCGIKADTRLFCCTPKSDLKADRGDFRRPPGCDCACQPWEMVPRASASHALRSDVPSQIQRVQPQRVG